MSLLRALLRASCAFAFLLHGSRLMAENATASDRNAQRQALADALFVTSKASGLVMVVIDQDEAHFLARGHQNPDGLETPNADSLVRINSHSKILAADLFSRQIAAGAVSLTTPLARLAPSATATVPGGDAITLADLATHTGGIPRNVPDDSWPDDAPPNTWPDADFRWHWLATLPPPPAPGRRALYSTPGFLFLGDALAIQAKEPYAGLLQQQLTGPLGMNDTTAEPSPAQCARLMHGSDRETLYRCADTRNTAASAGMYSTARDMGRWMVAMLAQDHQQGYLPWHPQRTRDALESVEGLDVAGHADAVGLGWILQQPMPDAPLLVEKTGAGGGFTDYIALLPQSGRGIFVATTHYDRQTIEAIAAQVNVWLLHQTPATD